jgi:aspartate kinase
LTQPDKPEPEFSATIDLIRQEHIDAAKESVRDPDILRELEAEIEKDCSWVKNFLFAAQVRGYRTSIGISVTSECQVIDEISPRSKDTIIGLGESLACKFMTAVLRDQVCTYAATLYYLTAI